MKRTHVVMSILACALLSACTINPLIATRDPQTGALSITSLGGSVLSRAKAEWGTATAPDGRQLTYGRVGKTETAAPMSSAIVGGSIDLIKAAPSVVTAGQ